LGDSGLSSRDLSNGAGSVGQAKLSSAFKTQPNDDMWSVSPEKGTYFASYLHGFVNAQALQRLDIENPIVEFSLRALFPVNTLPLPKHLSSHTDSPFPRAASHEILNHSKKRRDGKLSV
jgi:hypothetical protein